MDSIVPTKKDGPRRAKDFVRCTDPACAINKVWSERKRRCPNMVVEALPHAHPTF